MTHYGCRGMREQTGAFPSLSAPASQPYPTKSGIWSKVLEPVVNEKSRAPLNLPGCCIRMASF